MPTLTNITFHGLDYVPNPSSSQGNSSPLEKGWFILQRTVLQFKLEAFGKHPGDRHSQSHRTCEASKRVTLTLHCCACGFCEEWNKEEIDEVDKGQGIVPEQASCRNKDINTDLPANL